MKRYPEKRLLLIIFILLLLIIIFPAQAERSETGISGIWLVDIPAATHEVVFLPCIDRDSGYRIIMLDPGRLEDGFGYETGDLVAELEESGEDCWEGEEVFRFPLMAGGGSYIAETSYCLSDDGDLHFHTSDPNSVLSDYTLLKQADSIDAAGYWKTEIADEILEILLVPSETDGWEAFYITGMEGLDATEKGDVILTGSNAPDNVGVECSVISFPGVPLSADVENGAVAVLVNDSRFEIRISDGPEKNILSLIFERVY